MTFLELAKERYSVRSFKDTPIEPEKLGQVLEAGCGQDQGPAVLFITLSDSSVYLPRLRLMAYLVVPHLFAPAVSV